MKNSEYTIRTAAITISILALVFMLILSRWNHSEPTCNHYFEVTQKSGDKSVIYAWAWCWNETEQNFKEHSPVAEQPIYYLGLQPDLHPEFWDLFYKVSGPHELTKSGPSIPHSYPCDVIFFSYPNDNGGMANISYFNDVVSIRRMK